MGGWEELSKEWRSSNGATNAQYTARNFVGGEWRDAAGTLVNTAPSTGRKIGTIPRSGAADVQAAVDAATAAMAGPWGKTTKEERSALLHKIADKMQEKLPLLAALESIDQGKTIGLASTVDIPRAISNFRFFAGALIHGEGESYTMNNSAAMNYTQHSPIGVVGLITPWNLPLYLLSWKVAPALAMGNVIVAKPSEVTPFTGTVLAEILHEVGVPKGVFNVVHGLGAEAGQAILEHPSIRAISFTGGTTTGRLVARTAAPLFKKVSLELGGKNPTIVFADCDFETTVAGAVTAGFANQGEVCLCGSRLLVERPIYDRFVAEFVKRVKQFKVGDPRAATSHMGSLVSAQHKKKVESFLALAKKEGGKVECGGKFPADIPREFAGGAFLEPTVITGLPHAGRVSTEEIFGPIVTVHPFDTAAEAVAIANETEYGLAGSVWTSDLNKGHLVAQSLDTGMVWVNCWMMRDLRVPFGGVKSSGVGREGGKRSLEFFSESKNICINLPSKL